MAINNWKTFLMPYEQAVDELKDIERKMNTLQ